LVIANRVADAIVVGIIALGTMVLLLGYYWALVYTLAALCGLALLIIIWKNTHGVRIKGHD